MFEKNFKSIFITGANGWLGKRLVYLLINGYNNISITDPNKIFCFVPKNENDDYLRNLNVNIIKGDIKNISDCENFLAKDADGLVIHAAGIVHAKIFSSDFNKINFLGSKNIFTAARNNKHKKFIAISSNSCFGSRSDSEIFDDDSNYNPYAKYGSSKFKMERYLKKQADNSLPNITILRPMWFYGPGQPPRQTTFFKMVKNGKFPLLGNGKNLRSMTYIDNLIESIALSSRLDLKSGESFWIADEKPYEMIEIINTIKKVLSNEFNIEAKSNNMNIPSFVSDIARLADLTIQFFGLYQQKIHVLSEMNQTIACKVNKAKKILDYDPKVSLYEGMKNSIDWCIKNNIKI